MNKNWLYRILAIALVAMLALPVFAMAEEVDTFELGADEPEVVEKLGFEPGSTAPDWYGDTTEDGVLTIDFTSAQKEYTLIVDLANPEHLIDFLVEGEDTLRKQYTVKKSTGLKYATLDNNGHLTIKAPGTAKFTLYTKSNLFGEEKTVVLKVIVKNSAVLHIRQEDEAKNLENSTVTCAVGMEPVPFEARFSYKDDDDNWNDYGVCDLPAPDDTTTSTEDIYVTWSSSNSKVVAIGFLDGFVTIKKAGTVKITARLYKATRTFGDKKKSVEIKKVSLTFKALKNKMPTCPHIKEAYNAAKRDGRFFFGIKDAEYTSQNKDGSWNLQVKFFFCNGTKNTIKTVYNPAASIGYYEFENASQKSFGVSKDDYTVFIDGTDDSGDVNSGLIKAGKYSVNWKAGKKGTFTKTFKTDTVIDLTNWKNDLAVIEFFYSLTNDNDEDPIVWKEA